MSMFSPPSPSLSPPMDQPIEHHMVEPEENSPPFYVAQTSMAYEEKEEHLENNITDGTNGFTPVVKENDVPLKPVPPGYAGEGLPYAPVDWPNPGDNWGWSVGRRSSKSGYYADRFLFLPKRLQKPSNPKKRFASKPALERYIQTEFPGVDVDAFFASFSWNIPSTKENWTKDVSPQVETEGVGKEGKEEKEETPPTTQRKGKRKAARLSATPKQKTQSRQTRHTGQTRPTRQTRQSGGRVNLDFLNGEGVVDESAMETPEETPVDPVEFDQYLNSLDDILAQPVSEPPFLNDSPVSEDEIIEAGSRLSSLLDMDFPSLFCSKDLSELASLASKLRKNPKLSAEQLVKLKLIEEIPSFSEVFLENKVIAEQADKFFEFLEANKAKVATLKKDYSELKEQVSQLQAEVDSSLSTVQEIDDQITQLRSQRAELTSTIETKKKIKVDLTTAQNVVANSIPRVVQEIQLANSKRPEWELKKENAAKREAEILDKFTPLKGFSL